MKKGVGLKTISPYRLWSLLPPLENSHVPDLLMFAAAIALFYGVLVVARTWLGPFTPAVEISRSPLALPAYAGLSLLRITIAYVLSLAFTLIYGYVAAYNAKAERFMIPLLDVLQSIPGAQLLAWGNAGDGRVVSQPAAGRRDGRDTAHLYRTSLEHGVSVFTLR